MKRKIILFLFIYCLIHEKIFCQGYNHSWLLGYDFTPSSAKARINFTANSDTLFSEQRTIPFLNSTEGNISDKNGNLLMASNGVWVANTTGDTMLNGSGLNPTPFTLARPHGLPLPNGNVFLPWPDDSTKYVLIHQTVNNNATLESTKLYYSIIDMNLDGGFGGVVQKNNVLISDTIGWGIGACKHANGRDWWIVVLNDSMQYVYKVLLTPNGFSNTSIQNLNNMQPYSMFAAQPVFSPDGTKFAYPSGYGYGNGIWYHDIRMLSFDRCTGVFSNPLVVDLNDSIPGFGVAFSSNSKFLYTSSMNKIYQLNTDTINISASIKIVAVNDSFSSPFPPLYTDFLNIYLAANGKIYLTSSNTVLDLHYMNYPDSIGLACDVHQHAIHLPCFNGRAVPNHPNYYLGPVVASACDTLTGMSEHLNVIKNFQIKPNPNNGNFSISYLLPQNKLGWFEVYDLMGKEVFKTVLPPWSTLQNIHLPPLSSGIYNAVIKSGYDWDCKKIVIIHE